MKVAININENFNKYELKNSLIKVFPIVKNKINKILNSICINDAICIDDNNIYIDNYFNFLNCDIYFSEYLLYLQNNINMLIKHKYY